MEMKKKEAVLPGLVGAFLGSLVGVAVIVIIGQMGYVAAISGVVMAVCAIKGYELLAGTMSRKGAGIALLLTILMTYVGNRLDFAFLVSQAAEVGVFESFRAIDDLLEEEYLNSSAYWGNLIMLYVFTLLGAVPTLLAAFRRGTPVSIPPETTHASSAWTEDRGTEPAVRLYPFAELSWTRILRISLCLPLFLALGALMALLFQWIAGDRVLPTVAAIGGSLLGLVIATVWMVLWVLPFQNIQYVFVRTGRELWRVDLAKLNRIEPYRFSTKSGAIRVLRWEVLKEEERQRATSAIERAIHSIRAGEVMPDSILRHIVLYLPDVQLEQENKWVWKISYALNSEVGGSRRRMTIGKVYPNFAPTTDATQPEGRLPGRWSFLLAVVLLVGGLGGVGYGIGTLIDDGGAGRSYEAMETEPAKIAPESTTVYEQDGVRFQVDSTYENLDGAGQFQDPINGTIYMLGVQLGADQEAAMDLLLEPIGEFRKLPIFEGFSFAYPSEEEDLVELTADDGTVYRHNLLSIHFSDGQTMHSAVSLSDSGVLIQVLVIQDSRETEEQVIGKIRHLLTTLTMDETTTEEESTLPATI